MQPRGRARPNRGADRSRGRGRGRGNPNNTTPRPPRPRPDSHSVPPHASIHPGTPVSIILKEDQPTGHQVTGIVLDLLTRGDHPRGVKVRLRDGRVGRVQRLVSEAEGERGEAVVGGAGANVGRNGEGSSSRMVGGRMERDIREYDEYLYDEGRKNQSVDAGYFAELDEADRRERESRGVVGKGEMESEVVTCPVCGVFEGDERAVAFHVEGHFGE